MLHITICDDEKTEIEYLCVVARKWAEEHNLPLLLSAFESSESFLFDYQENKSVNILLLDIQMKALDGIELAKIIRKENKEVQIIFITGFSDSMSEGYEVCALHYLIKPVEEQKLFEVLDKAVAKLEKIEPSLLLITDGETKRIKQNEILYCESVGHNINIVTKTKTIEVKLPISTLNEQLDNTFVRCHRSYIVGIRHIDRITKTDVILDNEKSIPLSRRMYQETNQAFIKYFSNLNEVN